MSITVRRAGAADAGLVAALNADVQALHAAAMPDRYKPQGPDTFPAADAADLLAKPERLLFLAHLGRQPAGYAHAEIVRRPETSLAYAQAMVHVHAMNVVPCCRRQGVGRALLQAVRDAGAEHGIALVTLDVWMFNETARAFYRQRGFTPYIERLWLR